MGLWFSSFAYAKCASNQENANGRSFAVVCYHRIVCKTCPPPNVCSKKLLCKRSVLRKVMLRERWNCDKGWQRKVFPNCAANVIFPARHCVRTPPGPTFLAIVSRRTLLANQRFVCASACDVVTIRGVASKARDTRQ